LAIARKRARAPFNSSHKSLIELENNSFISYLKVWKFNRQAYVLTAFHHGTPPQQDENSTKPIGSIVRNGVLKSA
jgi:hypothetical protein